MTFRDVIKALAALVSRAIHAGVHLLPSRWLTQNVRLKHRYDCTTFWAPPDRIERTAVTRTVAKNAIPPAGPGRLAAIRHGGLWKTIQRNPGRWLQGTFVLAGDWDLTTRPFKAPSAVAALVNGEAVVETYEYRRMMERVEAGEFGLTKGCRSPEAVVEYFRTLGVLVEEIRRHGYRSQRELGRDPSDEVRVCVDRNGELAAFGGGTHRLAIAKALAVPRIPVVVRAVHRDWVEGCMERYKADLERAVQLGLDDLFFESPPQGAGDPVCEKGVRA